MRLVDVNAPSGKGEKIAKIALDCGVPRISVHQARTYGLGGEETRDMVRFECSTPAAKKFVDALTAEPFYDPGKFSISIRQPHTIISSESPDKVTIPLVIPTTDIYEELWQFSHITISFVSRILIAAMLISFGMIHDHLLILIAGLMFLPLQTNLLAVAFGACTKEWRLLFQGLKAAALAVLLTIIAGAFVAMITGPPLQFQTFGSPGSSFLMALILGIAAAMASADDVGRRELIGLAVTAQVTVLPAWVGISTVFGFPEAQVIWERVLTFFLIIGTLMLTAGITYALIGIRGEGLRRYADCTSGDCPSGPTLMTPGNDAMSQV